MFKQANSALDSFSPPLSFDSATIAKSAEFAGLTLNYNCL